MAPSIALDRRDGFRTGLWSAALLMEYTTRPKTWCRASTGPKVLLSAGRASPLM